MGIFAFEGIDEFSEGLNLTEHIDVQAEASRTGDFDELKEKSQELIDSAIETDTTDAGAGGDEPPQDSPGEGSPEDSQDDTTPPSDDEGLATGDAETAKDDEKDPKEDKPDGKEAKDEGEPGDEEPTTKDGKRQTSAAESFRNLHYDRVTLRQIDLILSSESAFSAMGEYASAAGGHLASFGSGVGNFLHGAASKIVEVARELAVYLFHLGVKYSPAVWRFVKKSTVYLFTKSLKLFFKTFIYISDYSKRRQRSFDKHLVRIAKLREKLQNFKQSGTSVELRTKSMHDPGLASWFYSKERVDPIRSASVISEFARSVLSEIDTGVKQNVEQLSKLLEASEAHLTGNRLNLLTTTPLHQGFGKKTLPTLKTNTELVSTFVYQETLPDKLLFACVLPNSGVNNLDDMAKAYQESGMFLTPSQAGYRQIDEVDYMDIKGIDNFLNELERLCTLGKEHAIFYQKLAKQISGLKPGYRNFYQKLCESAEEAEQREELMEYVYLKQMFLSRVYVPSATDIHDYMASYLVKSLHYVEECIKNLRVSESTV